MGRLGMIRRITILERRMNKLEKSAVEASTS